MGTINYNTSKYITLAIKNYTITEDYAIEYLLDMGYTEEEIEDVKLDDVILTLYQDNEEADYYNAEYILKKYDFRYFNVDIITGYYEGLQVDIKINDYGLWAGDEEDFKESILEAIEEIEDLKNFMVDLAGVGFQACYPGWVTGWLDYDETLEEIELSCELIKTELLEMEY